MSRSVKEGGSRSRYPDWEAAIGARIRLRRRELGMSLTALAGQCAVTYQQIQKYETGENSANGTTLRVIAKALGVTIGYLVGDGKPTEAELTLAQLTRHSLAVRALRVLDELGSPKALQWVELGESAARGKRAA
jgi:transcriptional regulator with XRE-family HTH domain